MNITRRRGAVAFFITLGALLVGGLVTLNIDWILLHKERAAYLVVGIVLFALLIAGVTLNTVFLVREIRRNERQDSFLNAVTHELKTPIASIRLYLETLERRAATLTEDQRHHFYTVMLADSDRLLATVEQVLKAGQLGHRERQLNRIPLDLASLTAECIATTLQRHHLPGESITLSGRTTATVSGIPDDLRTAVLNLLDNAVKYSPAGVHITCTLAADSPTSTILTIADNGLGIPPKELKRVFHRFYRVPGRHLVSIKGTGLGLFLVRTIARQHGGTVSADSPGPNLGTTITLRLPTASSNKVPA